jgi:hypothetical protein
LQVLLDEADFVKLARHRWFALVRNGTPYAARTLNGKTVAMHRILMGDPAGLQVDHVNHDTLDNRRSNLRVCSQAENLRNRRSRTGASRFKGVSPTGSKWRADIRQNGKGKYLGTFQTEEEASAAYDRAAREFYGAFAKTNE